MNLIVWRLEPESAEGQLGSMAAENTYDVNARLAQAQVQSDYGFPPEVQGLVRPEQFSGAEDRERTRELSLVHFAGPLHGFQINLAYFSVIELELGR
jgi:hypothetical protein